MRPADPPPPNLETALISHFVSTGVPKREEAGAYSKMKRPTSLVFTLTLSRSLWVCVRGTYLGRSWPPAQDVDLASQVYVVGLAVCHPRRSGGTQSTLATVMKDPPPATCTPELPREGAA